LSERAAPARSCEPWLFAAFTLVLALPLWLPRHVPLQDAPVHLENATILVRSLLEDAPDLREHYVIHERIASGALGHWLLAALVFALGRAVALKVFLTACVLLLTTGVRRATRALRPGGERLGWLAFPFVYNRLFQLGFLPFSLGLGLLFWFVALALESRERETVARGVALGLLGALVALAHVACAFVAVAATGLLLVTRPGRRSSPFAALALGPPTLLGAWEALGSGYGTLPPPPWSWDLATALKFTATLQVLVCHRDIEKGLALGVVALFGLATTAGLARRAKRPSFEPGDALAALAIAFAVAAVLSRDARSLYFFAHTRWILVAYLIAILWLAQQEIPRWLARALPAAAAGLGVAFATVAAVTYGAIDRPLEEALTVAAALEPGETLVPLDFAPNGRDANGGKLSSRIAPFLHVTGEIASASRAIDLTNDFYAVELRKAYDPGPRLRTPDQLEACARWLAEGGDPDAVVVLCANEADRRHPVFATLAARYERVFTSEQGVSELWRRKR